MNNLQFTIYNKFFLGSLFIVACLLFVPQFVGAQTVGLSGFAWSDLPTSNTEVGAGWISFSGPGYGVVANTSTGNLSGYAWSSTYGWLSFNSSDVSGCPSAPCQPNVNPSTGATTGWARFIAAPAGTTGVWNGWVHLTGSNYAVTYSSATQQFSGYAWGQNDIGWMRWAGTAQNGSPYAVTMSPLTPPDATINISVFPPSASWTLNPGSINGTGNATATVTPSQAGTSYTVTGGAAPSGYIFPPTITNSQGGGDTALILPNSSTTFTIIYTQAFDYNLTNDGGVNVQKAGVPQSDQNVITATQTAGAGQAVTLSASGLPSNVSVGFSNQGCVPSAGSPCNFTATFTVLPSAISGTYPITVTGSPLSQTTNFNLTITSSPNMILSCVATPSSAQVGDDVTWNVTISDPNNNAPYTFSWSGVEVPVDQTDELTATQSFIMSYSTTGSKQIQATVWDNVRNQSMCPASFINIGVNPNFGEF